MLYIYKLNTIIKFYYFKSRFKNERLIITI